MTDEDYKDELHKNFKKALEDIETNIGDLTEAYKLIPELEDSFKRVEKYISLIPTILLSIYSSYRIQIVQNQKITNLLEKLVEQNENLIKDKIPPQDSE